MKLKKKICIVSAGGGHLTEVRALRDLYSRYDHFYVLDNRVPLAADMEGRTEYIYHSERDLLFFANLWLAWKILRRERPSVILSTGSGSVVPFALVGKLLGIKSIFIECATAIKRPTLSGRIMYRLADDFFYQWEELAPHFPNGRHGGLLLL